MLLIPATYLAGRLLFHPRVGLFASIVVALSPIHISYSQIARVYALLPLLALCTAVTLHYLIQKRRRIDIVLHALALAATVWCHQWGVLLVPAAYIALYLTTARKTLPLLLIAHVIAFALCAPLLPAARPNPHQADVVASFYGPVWHSTAPSLVIPRSLQNLWAGGAYSPHTTKKIVQGDRETRKDPRSFPLRIHARIPSILWRILCWGTLLLVLFNALAPRPDRSDRGRWMGDARTIIIVSLAVPLVLALLFSWIVTPIYLVGRQDVMVLPFLALLAGLGASRYSTKGMVTFMAIYALLAASTLIPFYSIEYNEGNRVRAAFLLENVRANDVILYTGYRQSPVEYYMRPRTAPCPSLAFPSDIDEWRTGLPFKRYAEDPSVLPADAQATVEKATALLADGGSLYVIPAGNEWMKFLDPLLTDRLGQPDLLSPGGVRILRY